MTHAHCVLDNYGYRHTHLKYVILIALPRQKWLRERALISGYTYIASPVVVLKTKTYDFPTHH
jgi:hypothetical protein